MAIHLINIGNIANDGTGDDLRQAFLKVNENFQELDLRGDATTASNIGTQGVGVFSRKIQDDLQFKNITVDSKMSITTTDEQISIGVNTIGQESLTISADNDTVLLDSSDTVSIVGGQGISTELVDDQVLGKVITITNTQSDLSTDQNPTLSNNLDVNGNDIINANVITANEFQGNLTGDVTGTINGYDISAVAKYFEFNNFDFGEIVPTITNIVDWFLSESVVDFGSLRNPSYKTVDLGGFV